MILALLILISSWVQAAEVTLHFYPSPVALDWSSPRSLVKGVVSNFTSNTKEALQHPIGHVTVHVRCDSDNSEADEILTGMTGAREEEQSDAILKDKRGLGVLFQTFRGQLQDRDVVLKDILEHSETGRFSWLTTKISERTCLRLKSYFQEYVSSGYWMFYGLPLRPRNGEGAGCSAFGVSFLELAGILTPEMQEAWQIRRAVPLSLIGDPLKNIKISVRKLIRNSSSKYWALTDQPSKEITFWSPDDMHKWAVNTWMTEMKNPTGNFKLLKRGKALGLWTDRSQVSTPTEPIWKN